jgi:hypothetical protein
MFGGDFKQLLLLEVFLKSHATLTLVGERLEVAESRWYVLAQPASASGSFSEIDHERKSQVFFAEQGIRLHRW